MFRAWAKKTLFWMALSTSLLGSDNSEWNRVYLATFPRSGNHWLRFLIEEVTGVATGSIYQDGGGIYANEPDANHLPKNYPWGGYCTDHGYTHTRRYPTTEDIVVIKTHYPLFTLNSDKMDLAPDGKVLCIIRHPVDCLVSFERYRGRDHISFMHLKNLLADWRNFYEYWENHQNLLMIRYEDLLFETFSTLQKVFDFMEIDVNREDIQRAMSLYPPVGNPLKSIGKYTHEQQELMKTELKDLLEKYGYTF